MKKAFFAPDGLLRRHGLKFAAASALLSFVLSIASQLFLRNFYRFLSFDEQFCQIFKQISLPNTQISAPFLILFLMCIPVSIALFALWHRSVAGRILAVAIGSVAFVLLCAASILFTRVNGVMFLDVVLSLVPLLTSGAL